MKSYRRWGIFILGIVIILVGLFVYVFSGREREIDYQGPSVMFACTDPNQEIEIYETIEDQIVTILPIIKSETTLWVWVADQYEISWECTGDFEAVEFYGTQNNNLSSKVLNEKSGHGNNIYFRLKSGSTHYSTIKLTSKYTVTMANKVKHIRLPWIANWMSESIKSFITEGTVSTANAAVLDTKIDGESLFVPAIGYTVSLLDPSFVEKNLKARKIIPEPVIDGAYFVWSGEAIFMPQIEYDVIDLTADTLNTNIFACCIGIGLSLIVEGLRKREQPYEKTKEANKPAKSVRKSKISRAHSKKKRRKTHRKIRKAKR